MTRASFLAVLVLAAVPVTGQPPDTEPTVDEIEQAYRTKAAGGGGLVRWEVWRTKEVRGWALKFKRLHEDKSAALITRRYQAIAKKNGSCAEYSVVEAIPLGPTHPPALRYSVTVERLKSACRAG